MINLAEATIDNEDMDALADWLRTHPRLTKGPLTLQFEQKWAEYIGCKYATFVNSGSSANLLMIAALLEDGTLRRGDSVVVPALSWATDLAPVMQLGLQPLLCDCNQFDLGLNLRDLDRILHHFEPKAILQVSVLGLPPAGQGYIVNACADRDIVLLEDACESLGSTIRGRKLGTFGKMSSFSMYFGHHISTIEGGMICTDDEHLDNILKSIRSHGWGRDWPEVKQKREQKLWEINDFDALYSFFHAGFNLRSTDLQAFIGLRQLDKLPDIVKVRHNNYHRYQERLFNTTWVPTCPHDVTISAMAFPIRTHQREKLVKALQEAEVETRPLICGSMGRQPFYIKQYGEEEFPVADALRTEGMYLPNHHLLTYDDIDGICKIVEEHGV